MTLAAQKEFPCRQCGAQMSFDPSAGSIKCPYCGTVNEIARPAETVAELDFLQALSQEPAADVQEVQTVTCSACGAVTALAPDVTADRCPFCSNPIVAAGDVSHVIRPKSLLPFAVTRDQAVGSFRKWISSLWFAPTRLRRYARTESASLAGMYIPYWTYDCATVTAYTGRRGDDYTETEHYTTTINGKTEHRTRTVTKTRWHSVSGTVNNSFDDILVLASRSLPPAHTRKLEPWDLAGLTPYDEKYLAGFRAESYQVDLKEGFEAARTIMAPTIDETIREDIGGDHQQISSQRTQYNNITFKHILLPIWISAYNFHNRVFRFLVNGRTGEVQGERPWSFWKIFAFAAGIAAAVAAVAAIAMSTH